MTKKLKDLTALLPECEFNGNEEQLIHGIAHDSRKVTPGTLFVCLSGNVVDGHNFITEARQRGAAAILVEKDVSVNDIAVVKVADTRAAMRKITPFFYDYPAHKLRMIGITGTNGKTTTTYLIREILRTAGYKVGVIGTIQILIEDESMPISNTTPDVIDLQAILAEMVRQQIDYVVMEVSSHALALNRVDGCEFDVGVFTNMTQDHLDFHGTFEKYAAAKAELFRKLGASGNVKSRKTAIVNVDDVVADLMLEKANCNKITYAVQNEASLSADNIRIESKGAKFEVNTPYGKISLDLNITGLFNVYNVLAAIGATFAEGIGINKIKKALESFKSVPGRFEIVDAGQPFSVIVDYAHTPDGLENILKTARGFAEQRIIIVFGCGGDRDRTKRPIMGALAVQYADVIIATSDNPRTEDPDTILDEIETGIISSNKDNKLYRRISDRKKAIYAAISIAAKDDIVIIAGKGHETYQILKDKTISFDDREIAREAIREMK
ncbi:MAG: UDP-N-acetylmuramoyl-L-alanyl-D-glutamate--2,6-diaminopimelate ligase [Veillonellaceae bacterium]|jgi:UDP-N-acetylmuramoyl-L-alanyl-D-glutamate--2,6-diaminopimelate ligase|nr:UDP-N-acetylmuramoyl-L-alanyl-D-glutamate--2,6-diaminopimelate ligase [Veillonellaceae bacterium]